MINRVLLRAIVLSAPVLLFSVTIGVGFASWSYSTNESKEAAGNVVLLQQGDIGYWSFTTTNQDQIPNQPSPLKDSMVEQRENNIKVAFDKTCINNDISIVKLDINYISVNDIQNKKVVDIIP